MDIHEQANEILCSRYRKFLEDTRAEIYNVIEGNREMSRFENECVLPELVNEIKSIGRSIEIARECGAPDDVIRTLIRQVQKVNRARHTNRETLKELAEEQAVAKAMLAEINREISYMDEFYYGR